MKTCKVCGASFEHHNPHKETCSQKCRYSICAAAMANTNRRLASGRMKARNPMRLASVRMKVSDSLRAMNYKPKVRGGNGVGPTVPQKLLADALGWQMEYAIPTKMRRGLGYPTAYKVDIANPAKMIAVEVDGNSHCAVSRKNQDSKKAWLLATLGWHVLRFTNHEVMADLVGCVQTVTSITSKSSAITTTLPPAS